MTYVCRIDKYTAIVQQIRVKCFVTDGRLSGQTCIDTKQARGLEGGTAKNCKFERELEGGSTAAGADLISGSAETAG